MGRKNRESDRRYTQGFESMLAKPCAFLGPKPLQTED